MNYVIQAAQLLLGISILVVLHELGHFIPAKLFKTRVEKFYLFFDPWFSIFKKKKGETEYGIGWLPLGGYVKIAGMVDESMDKEQLKKPAEPWEFRAKPTWQRLIIMLGGVTVNVIVAFVIYAMILFTWGEQYLPANNAVYGVYCDSTALNIGFEHGDKIVALNDTPIDDDITYGEITAQLLLDGVTTATVDRNGDKINIAIPENFAETVVGKGVRGLFSEQIPFIIDTILPNKPAAKAGFMKGDKIVAVNQEKAEYFQKFFNYAHANKNKEITVTVLRNNAPIDLNVTVSKKGIIGVGNQNSASFFDIKEKEYGFFEAIPAGIAKTGNVIKRYVDQFKLIFSKAGMSQLGGFGTISKLYGSTWVWENFWEKTAFISVILAVMNLLPIPALDGGHVMFLSYEMITGRKPHEKVMEYAQMAGMILLLVFMVYANGMDIIRGFFSN